MACARRLLINCDDLGYHPTFNEAIVEILLQGVVRSASIMPAAPYFDDACSRLATAGITGVGVHLTISSEYPRLPIRPLSDPRRISSLVTEEGRFFGDIAAVRDRILPEQVAEEFRNQIDRACAAGLRVTHLDGHMFCYEPDVGGVRLLEVAEAVAAEYGVPLRIRSQSQARSMLRTHMFWKGADETTARFELYRDFFLSYDESLSELIIHPGKDLSPMQEFCATAVRRQADYLFFRDEPFYDLVRSRGIRVITWPEV